jgi:dolichyl-diphosphooligosaccharide--protein glycosyltransferase
MGCAGLLLTFLIGVWYHDHGVMMGRHYAGNQVTFHAHSADGSLVVVDDFREAYKWLRENTPEDAKVLSWWDYGYQLSAFSNRTVIVDNNTWNNTHIATVGKVLASSEEDAAPLLRRLDADYVMVVYGGAMEYAGDDLAKFYWISRITSGVFPEVDYRDYTVMTSRGYPSLDVNPETGSPLLTQSLIYRLSYHGITGKRAFDNSRKSRFQHGAPLRHLEEAFSSQNLLVRLYRVKPDPGVPPPDPSTRLLYSVFT